MNHRLEDPWKVHRHTPAMLRLRYTLAAATEGLLGFVIGVNLGDAWVVGCLLATAVLIGVGMVVGAFEEET